MDITNTEEKEMTPMADYEKWKYEMQNCCHICKKKFCYDKDNKSEYEVYRKVRDHYH